MTMTLSRRLHRLTNWWHHLGAREFGWISLGCAIFNPPLARALPAMLLYSVAFFLLGVWGYLLNDIADAPRDGAAGKSNSVRGLDRPLQIGSLLGLLLLDVCVWLLIDPPPAIWVLLGIQVGLLATYSLPPLRLKSRGGWGVIADACYGHVLPALVTLLVFFPPLPGWRFLIGLAGVHTFARGIRSILTHQLEDRNFDRRGRDATYVVRVGLPTAIRAIRVAVGVETAAFSWLMGIAVVRGGFWLVACGYAAWILVILRRARGFSARRPLAAYRWRYWVNPYYEVWFPALGFVEMLARVASLWPLALVYFVVFPFTLPRLRGDAHELARAAIASAKRLWPRAPAHA